MNQFLYVQKSPSLYTECYHWPLTLLAPFKRQDILALLRYYQNVLDMIFGTDSLETRQIYIDFWRTQFENYRAYPTLFTKEPLRSAIQKHHLPIDLLETFLVAVETSFLIRHFDQKKDLDEEIEAMSNLTSKSLCVLFWTVLAPKHAINQVFCETFGKAILLLSLIHLYPEMIEKQEIYALLSQARLLLLNQNNPRLTPLLKIIELSIKILKQKTFMRTIPRLPLLEKIILTASR